MHCLTRLIPFADARLIGFVRAASGATAIEYALIAGGISIAIIVAVTSLGTTTNGMYETVVTALK